jgi:CBS domain-containing protein
MAEKKVHTLPVLKNGSLVGVVGKADIIRTLARG